MASSFSRGNQLFVSLYGPDFRPSFLLQFHKQLTDNGLTVFSGQGIGTTHAISPKITRAIRESRISIVVLSKNYAAWGRCLDELVEIFKSEEDTGLTVMTFFYGVDPSHVRKQIGEFGKVFNETCGPRKEEERRIWSQALTAVGYMAGEHSLNWSNPAAMFEKIAIDVSKKLNDKSKSRYSTAMAFLVVINLLLEIGSVVAASSLRSASLTWQESP